MMNVDPEQVLGENRQKENPKSEEREVCLLCFSLSKLHRTTNSPFAEEFDNFYFIEAQIGYSLPECVCMRCLEELNRITSFINMCKESREKYIKLLQPQRKNILVIAQTSTEVENTYYEPGEETGILEEEEVIEPEEEVRRSEEEEVKKPEEVGRSEEGTRILEEEVIGSEEEVRRPEEQVRGPEEETSEAEVQTEDESQFMSVSTESLNLEKKSESVPNAQPAEANINPDDIATEHSYHSLTSENCTSRRTGKICPDCKGTITKYVDHYKESPYCRPRNVSCSMCTSSFKTSQALSNHKVVHHSDQIPIVPFVCHVCPQTFKYKGNLQRHLRVHENSKQFICDQCGKGYTNKVQLQEHCQTHLNIKPYLCNRCGKQFSSRKMIYVHERAHENDEENPNQGHACHICKRSFTRRGLKAHMHTHSENKIYKCSKCEAVFETTKLHRRHMKEHPRKYDACPHCSKRVTRYTLKQHLKTHSEERPFACTQCDKKFRTRAHWEGHVEAIHTRKGTGRHKCKHCKKSFASKRSLETHEMRHTGKKPYKCHICDEAFVCTSTMKRHIVRIHGDEAIRDKD